MIFFRRFFDNWSWWYYGYLGNTEVGKKYSVAPLCSSCILFLNFLKIISFAQVWGGPIRAAANTFSAAVVHRSQ